MRKFNLTYCIQDFSCCFLFLYSILDFKSLEKDTTLLQYSKRNMCGLSCSGSNLTSEVSLPYLTSEVSLPNLTSGVSLPKYLYLI